jgi:YfiH family protein
MLPVMRTRLPVVRPETVPWLIPDWPAPPGVRACTTTRKGGISRPPYASLNLGDHVGDRRRAVLTNRQLLSQTLQLPAEPCWLQQVHGRSIVDAEQVEPGVEADGSFTRRAGVVCAVLTADCLPVLLCDKAGQTIAALHCGWRSLSAGIIAAAVEALDIAPAELMAWLGPAIGPDAFEVGADVRTAFVTVDTDHAAAFRSCGDRWKADIYHLARQQLVRLAVKSVYGGGRCTYTEADQFYSFRRDGTTGRTATLIWIDRPGEPRTSL